MFSKKSSRQNNTANAGSMADIAFLLLIFFLVTTTIEVDKGIGVRLPPWNNEEIIARISDRDVLSVKINTQNQLLVEGNVIHRHQIRATVKEFIMNPQQAYDKPSKPTQAIISLQNDRGTNYQTYIVVYNEIRAAYNELWEAEAQRQFGESYLSLSKRKQKAVRKRIPLVISEAEATDWGR